MNNQEKKCKYCAMPIPKEAKICPHCRKRQGIGIVGKTIAGLFVLSILISVVIEMQKQPAKDTAEQTNIQLREKRKKALPELEKIVNKLMKSGAFDSAKLESEYYAKVVVRPAFYGLDFQQKSQALSILNAYYMTLANKSENDIFATILYDNRSGKEVGKYQMGSLKMD